METKIIDGTGLARQVREEWRERARALAGRGCRPGLAVLIVGDDPASKAYVRNKVRACAELGLRSDHIELPAATSEDELLARIAGLNADPGIHGVLVQLPLPKHIASERVIEAIAPEKDVDGFHPLNVGLLATGHPRFAPCTPAGIMLMLEREGIDPWGQNAVILGASNIVGKPMALLLLQRGATVTLCNSKTRDLAAHTRAADILIAAVGRPNLVTGGMVKPGAVVIDVGINRLPDGKLAGDVDTRSVMGVASRVTPVPGGVGPMTVTMLVVNAVLAAERACADEAKTEDRER
ncbi:MAG: bifunctional methylenetetrahydrofolate dehydrogenase/methenyltetrahydrofolate cyclohydrolase FolD [Burkholderiales bacterium]|jgi:methylenetetrahydrofolate dehydrogenase (NADP+)/methenyltetrahydrofolate cyclohydrolase|nr:bifunctional methylenetetrahydrofolate dehydrogenase/methenyltetrahydrofolate cyclohydrolase FolD [Burkholderiales bacterium]